MSMEQVRIRAAADRMHDARHDDWLNFIHFLGGNAAGRMMAALEQRRPVIERHMKTETAASNSSRPRSPEQLETHLGRGVPVRTAGVGVAEDPAHEVDSRSE